MIPAAPEELLRRWQTEGARPRTLQAVLEFVAFRLRGQQTAEAVAVLRRLLALHEHPVLWGYLAQAETMQGHPDKAAEALVSHLKLEFSPAVYVAAVDAYLEAGKKDRAKALAARAPTAELKDLLASRLKNARTAKSRAPKSLKALAKSEREVLLRILGRVPMETLAEALSGEKDDVRGVFLDCFSGGPKHRLVTMMGREVDAKARARAKKALLEAAG